MGTEKRQLLITCLDWGGGTVQGRLLRGGATCTGLRRAVHYVEKIGEAIPKVVKNVDGETKKYTSKLPKGQ